MSDIKDKLTPRQRELVELADAKGLNPRVEIEFKGVPGRRAYSETVRIFGSRTVQLRPPCECCGRGGAETRDKFSITARRGGNVTGTCSGQHRAVESYADVIRWLPRSSS